MRPFRAVAAMGTLNSLDSNHQDVPPELWREDVRRYLSSSSLPIHFVGAGNPLRRDDGIGIFIASALKSRITGVSRSKAIVHDRSRSHETLLSRLPTDEGLVVFDAVEAGLGPGSIICATIGDTRYSFFATHNVPLAIIPGVAERKDRVCVMGIEPESLGIGEGLSPRVKASAEALASEIANQLVSTSG